MGVALALAGLLAACQGAPNPPTATSPAAPPMAPPAATDGDHGTSTGPGPVPGTRITKPTPGSSRATRTSGPGRANIYNKRLAFAKSPEPGLLGVVLPFPPLNRVAMLTDYVDPAERAVACPNQDVVYGGGIFALDVSPVVVHGQQRRSVRHRLFHAHRRCEVEHPRQQTPGDEVLLPGPGRRRTAVEQRYSVGTKNKDLQKAADGSVTIYVQADEPKDPVQRTNWHSLTFRFYRPEGRGGRPQ